MKVYRTELTPVSFLHRTAYVFPDRTAVVHGERRYSYRVFEERVNRLAWALRRAGLEKHDRVAFLCPNTPPLLEAHFAVPAAGGILVAVNTRLGPEEVAYILSHSGARFLFVDSELESVVAGVDTSRIEVVHLKDTGAPGDPYEDFLATGSPDPVARKSSKGSPGAPESDRKSTRLNSSHSQISYAVFCLKKKKINHRGWTVK